MICFLSIIEKVISMNKEKTIKNFELGINRYLRGLGYKGVAYMDAKGLCLEIGDSNPYSKFALELIRNGKIPIIKKTNFYGKNRWFVNTIKAIQYIQQYCSYDVSLITSYVEEYRDKGLIGPYFDFENMEMFISQHNRIFIYGAGNWGHIVADYLMYKNIKFEGFVVTKPEGESLDFKSLVIEENDGVIIAQEYKNVCEEIIEYIRPRVGIEHIFTPIYPKE